MFAAYRVASQQAQSAFRGLAELCFQTSLMHGRLLRQAAQPAPVLAKSGTASVNAAESRAYQQELEALVQSRLRPGQRMLPELKSAPPVCVTACCSGH